MTSTVQSLGPRDRPRERLRALGPAALSSAELLAIVLGTGAPAQDVIGVAHGLLATAGGSLRHLASRPAAAWQGQAGIGPAKAARLLAAFELGLRAAQEERPVRPRIKDPEDVVRLLGPRLRDLAVEEFHLLALDSQSQVLREVLVTRGILDSSLVHPREVFRPAIIEAAAGIIVVHNHPSGDPTPSAEDRAVTRQLVAAGRLLDLPLYDHVIVAGDRWVSLAAAGLLG
ncbi:MAG: DNA repair protein RadC [Gemmatimonadales bacterium]